MEKDQQKDKQHEDHCPQYNQEDQQVSPSSLVVTEEENPPAATGNSIASSSSPTTTNTTVVTDSITTSNAVAEGGGVGGGSGKTVTTTRMLPKIPKRFDQIVKILEQNGWTQNRITGSHHIFTKPNRRRCIPLAFHGGSIEKDYARRVLDQAGILNTTLSSQQEELNDEELFIHHNGEWEDEVTRDFSKKTTKTMVTTITTAEQEAGNFHNMKKNAKKKTKERSASTKITYLSLSQTLAIDDLSKEEFLTRRQEEEKTRETNQRTKRRELLAAIQDLLAQGLYKDALAAIDKTRNAAANDGNLTDLFAASTNGSTSKEEMDELFSSNILFYQMVALSELGFEAKVNSQDQKKFLTEAFQLTSKCIESFPDRRDEMREFGKNMQVRIFQAYMKQTINYLESYGLSVKRELNAKQMGAELDNSDFDSFNQNIDNVVGAICNFAYFYGLTNCFTNRKGDIFISLVDYTTIFSALPPCIRKMLILFDMEEWDKAIEIVEALELFAKECKYIFSTQNLVIGYLLPSCTRLTEIELINICRHIRDLVPIYQYARQKYGWRRFVGLMNYNSDPRCSGLTVEEALDVVGQVSNVIMNASHIKNLVVFNGTRRFVFDTLADCVTMIHVSLEGVMSSSKSQNLDWKRFCIIFQGYAKSINFSHVLSFSEYLLLSRDKNLSEVQKPKYDNIRSDLMKLNSLLQWLANMFDDLVLVEKVHPNGSGCDILSTVEMLLPRVNFLPKSQARLNMLMNIALRCRPNWDTPSFTLQTQINVMNMDFDAAKWFGKKLEDMILLPQEVTGKCSSPSEVLASGLYSFDVIVASFVPLFLARYLEKDQTAKFLEIAIEVEQLEADMFVWAETVASLAFEVMGQVEQLEESIIQERNVINGLISAYKMFEGNGFIITKISSETAHVRWAKRKAGKYKKMIAKIRQRKPEILACLEKRSKGTEQMATLYKACMTKRKLIPQEIRKGIEKNNQNTKIRSELLVEAMKYSHNWSKNDIYDLYKSIHIIEEACEDATLLFNNLTSGRYPVIRATKSPKWKLQHQHQYLLRFCDFGVNCNDEIIDLMYVSGILKAYIENNEEK